jgi:CheY-like chemotaxis protein
MYELAFQSKGYEVTRALDGLTGVTKAVTLRPDVIILDIMMPNMDGFEVLQALRNNTSLRSLIITNSNLE